MRVCGCVGVWVWVCVGVGVGVCGCGCVSVWVDHELEDPLLAHLRFRAVQRVERRPASGLRLQPLQKMCYGNEAGSHLRPIDFCFTQLQAQGTSRTCDESKEEQDAEQVFRLQHFACMV